MNTSDTGKKVTAQRCHPSQFRNICHCSMTTMAAAISMAVRKPIRTQKRRCLDTPLARIVWLTNIIRISRAGTAQNQIVTFSNVFTPSWKPVAPFAQRLVPRSRDSMTLDAANGWGC